MPGPLATAGSAELLGVAGAVDGGGMANRANTAGPFVVQPMMISPLESPFSLPSFCAVAFADLGKPKTANHRAAIGVTKQLGKLEKSDSPPRETRNLVLSEAT